MIWFFSRQHKSQTYCD